MLWGAVAACIALAGLGGMVAASPWFSSEAPASLFSALVAERGSTVMRDIAYGPHARQSLDVYRPQADDLRDGPIVLFLYGGSWRFGEKATYGFLGAALALRGITTVIPDYRLFPEVKFPKFVDDAALAYRWIAEHEARGRPIFVMGHSAGAHTAAMLALAPQFLNSADPASPKPAGLIGLSGPYAFDPTTWESTRDVFVDYAGRADAARPVAFAGPDAPPALLMHGVHDGTVRLFNTRELAAALSAKGVPVRKLEFDNIEHIGILTAIAWPFRWRAPVLDEVVRFVKESAQAL